MDEVVAGALRHTNLIPPVDVLVSHKATGGRSTLLLERQINELTETFEEYKATTEARHKSSEGQLTRILDVVSRLDPSNPALPNSRASTPFLATSTTLLDVKPVFSNPVATPELVALVSKVVSEARGRVGRKKGGADDNSCKVRLVLIVTILADAA